MEMKTRLFRMIPAAVAATAIAAGGVGVAQASQGADDPAGHVRHTGADDNGRHHHRHHHHRRHHALRQGLDDQRVSDDSGAGRNGADDPAGDDHGATLEPGDDNGSGGHGADD